MVNIDYTSSEGSLEGRVMQHLNAQPQPQQQGGTFVQKATFNNSNDINSDRNDNNLTGEQDRTKPCEAEVSMTNGVSKGKVWGWLVPGHPSNPRMKVM